MAALFPAWANSVLWVALGFAASMAALLPTALIAFARTPYATGEDTPPLQPVKFDHRHHVRDDGIPCLYCHAEATRSAYAGVPPTSLCMNCHAQVWITSPELTPVRESYAKNEPIRWARVHSLPDHVFFNHAIHTNKGIGCVSCHGRVDLMAQVYPVAPLTMRWCLDCHRSPERHLRPLSEVANPEWMPAEPQEALGARLRQVLGVRSIEDCTACHR
jgi:hypothetical protein